MYMTCMVFCAQICCALADVDRAQSLYQLLLPYRGQTANYPTAVCFGAIKHFLGMLARTANEPGVAREHFERALHEHRAMRAWPSLARTLFHGGTFLVSRPAQADQLLGQQRLREADQLARRVDMTRLVFDIEAMLNESGRTDTAVS